MALDQAVYVGGGVDKIIGCRGKWLYKFNATTGALEEAARWCSGLINESSLTVIGTDLYVTGWRGIIETFGAATPYDRPNRNVFKVNATTLAVTSTIDVATEAATEFSTAWAVGFRNLFTDGTNLYGYSGVGAFFKADPSNVAATYAEFGGPFQLSPILDALYTSASSGLVFIAENRDGTRQITAVQSVAPFTECFVTPNGTSDPIYYGVTYAAVNGKAYAVGRDDTGTNPILIKLNANEIAPPAYNDFTYTELNILDPAGNPFRIKYNSVTSLLYIPEWHNDKVQIVDPTTDAVVATRTGFTDPIDVVFTPTKSFAVQNSTVGLLAIEEP